MDGPLPDVLKKYDGIPDRTILILTAEKLDEHLEDHQKLKRRFYTLAVITITAMSTAFFEALLRWYH